MEETLFTAVYWASVFWLSVEAREGSQKWFARVILAIFLINGLSFHFAGLQSVKVYMLFSYVTMAMYGVMLIIRLNYYLRRRTANL